MVTTTKKPTAPGRPELPRRGLELPRGPRSRERGPSSGSGGAGEGKQLLVGREIALSGEIKSCDRLIVEGTVDAALSGSNLLEILDGGVFNGPAEVEEADIGGKFQGSLTVHGRLLVRASGYVEGDIHYGELEVERGGTLRGTLDALDSGDGEIRALPMGSSSEEEETGS